MVAYVGEDKNISKVKRTDVQFHAMRAIQEFSFDMLPQDKSIEIEVPPGLFLFYHKITSILLKFRGRIIKVSKGPYIEQTLLATQKHSYKIVRLSTCMITMETY